MELSPAALERIQRFATEPEAAPGSTTDWATPLVLGLMAATTPAATEHPVELLDRIVARRLRSRVVPETIDPTADPITAPGSFAYPAHLLLTLGIRAMIEASDRSDETFLVARDDRHEYPWTHRALAHHVAASLTRPATCTSGDSIDPLALAAAGLGLLLHDRRFDTALYGAALDAWWPIARDHIVMQAAMDGSGIEAALTSLLLTPQASGTAHSEIADCPSLDVLASTDAAELEAMLTMPAAEAAERLTDFAVAPLERCPQIVDIDHHKLAVTRAEWIAGALFVKVVVFEEDPTATTTYRIIGAEPRLWYLTGIDGAWMDVTSSAVIMRQPLVSGILEFTPGSY